MWYVMIRPVVAMFLVTLSKPPAVALAYGGVLPEPGIASLHLDANHYP